MAHILIIDDNDDIVASAELDHAMEGRRDNLMLVEPRAPKQKVEVRFQVDDVEFYIECDWTNDERNNQNP